MSRLHSQRLGFAHLSPECNTFLTYLLVVCGFERTCSFSEHTLDFEADPSPLITLSPFLGFTYDVLNLKQIQNIFTEELSQADSLFCTRPGRGRPPTGLPRRMLGVSASRNSVPSWKRSGSSRMMFDLTQATFGQSTE